MPDLTVNLPVIVTETANLRAEPHRGADRVAVLDPGHRATITGGPVLCGDGLTWWQLDHSGWCVEHVGGEDVLEVAPATEFEKAMAFVFRQEGGFVDDPNDIGGRTKYGISQRSYPGTDIANLTKADARAIYHADYWLAAGCDALPWPLNFAHFDSAVNCGIGQASHFLSACNGDFETYNLLRRQFYQSLNQFHLYGNGWMRRVDELEKAVAQ